MRMVSFFEPDSVAEVMRILAAEPEARVVAGGQTLVEQLNARRISPRVLISLRRIADLKGLRRTADGTVVIGAMATHRAIVEADCLVGGHTLLAMAARQIASPAVRNVATIGGSVCRVDPNLDYPAVLLALDASMCIAAPGGERETQIADFYAHNGDRGLRPDELLLQIKLPSQPARSLAIYERVTRCAQDMPIISAALIVTMDGSVCREVRIGVGSCGPAPLRLRQAEIRLEGTSLSDADITQACRLSDNEISPINDVRASAAYRRMLVPRLLERALRRCSAVLATTGG